MSLFNKMLSAVESLFPMLPVKSPLQVSQECRQWLPDEVYYALDFGGLDDPMYKQRIKALLRFDRDGISFYRRREQKRQTLIRFRDKLRETALKVANWEYPW